MGPQQDGQRRRADGSTPTACRIPAQGATLGIRPTPSPRSEGTPQICASPTGPQTTPIERTLSVADLVKEIKTASSKRLKNPDGRPDHFDEMLERIRDIRD